METVDPRYATSFEPLAHCANLAVLAFSVGITLVDVPLNWLKY